MPLEVDYDECGIQIYKVFNDYGDLILITSDGYTASFVAKHVVGVPRSMLLVIGNGKNYNQPKKLFRKR